MLFISCLGYLFFIKTSSTNLTSVLYLVVSEHNASVLCRSVFTMPFLTLFGCAESYCKYKLELVGFLYTLVDISPDGLDTLTSRKCRQPSTSYSIVNLMSSSCVLRWS
jgi:hypothetical protein